MSIKLDDLLNEVKAPAEALDLAHTDMTSMQQFEQALSKVPEYKIRPEKVRPEEITGDGPNGWRGRGVDPHKGDYTNPLPPSMRGLDMEEFYQVDIDWRMLTTARPTNRLEEEVFSRYVDLGRAQLQRIREESSRRPDDVRITKVVPGRGSLPEVRIVSCRECGEELCSGACKDYMYDHYARMQPDSKNDEEAVSEADEEAEEKEEVKKKKKKRKKKRGKKKKLKKEETVEVNGEEADDEDDE